MPSKEEWIRELKANWLWYLFLIGIPVFVLVGALNG